MDKEEFIAYLDFTYEIDEVVRMLIRYGVCEAEDILELIEDFAIELEEHIEPDWNE